MKGYATYQLAKIRQHELIAAADQFRREKEARLASRGTVVPARRPLIWLREAAGGIAARLVTLRGPRLAAMESGAPDGLASGHHRRWTGTTRTDQETWVAREG